MQIRLIRTALVGGEVLSPSARIIDVPASVGRSLIELGKAVVPSSDKPDKPGPQRGDDNRAAGVEGSNTPPLKTRKQ